MGGCTDNVTYQDAIDICDEQDYRLCSQDELASGCPSATSCHFDGGRVWTSTRCSLTPSLLDESKEDSDATPKEKKHKATTGNRAVAKVTELLTVLMNQLKEDAKADKSIFTKYKSWYVDKSKSTKEVIEKTSAQIESLQSSLASQDASKSTKEVIEKTSAQIESLQSSLASQDAFRKGKALNLATYGQNLVKVENTLEDATTRRGKEKKTFADNEAEFLTAIDQLTRALVVLGKKAPGEKSGAASAASLVDVAKKMRSVLLQGPDFSLSPLQRETVNGFLRAVAHHRLPTSGSTDAGDGSEYEAPLDFLQTESSAAGPYGDYASQTGALTSAFDSVLAKAKANLKSQRDNEAKNVKAWKEFESGITDQIKTFKKSMTTIKGEISESEETSGKDKVKLLSAQNLLKVTKESLVKVEAAFLERQTSFNMRTKQRSDELLAVSEASRIMKSPQMQKYLPEKWEAKANLKSQRDNEAKNVKAWKEFESGITDQIKTFKKSMTTIKGEISESEETSGKDKVKLLSAQNLLKVAKDSLTKVNAAFLEKQNSFNMRTKQRSDELLAVSEASRIMKSPQMQKYLPEKWEGSFTQQDSPAESFLQVQEQDSQPRKPSGLVLLGMRSRLRRRSLMRIDADPFQKVKGLMRDMIQRLTAQNDADATQAGWCKRETDRTTKSKDDTTQEVAKLKAKIAEIDADLAQLKTELKKITEDAKNTRAAADKATLQRNSERAEVVTSIVRYKDAQRLLKAAAAERTSKSKDDTTQEVAKLKAKIAEIDADLAQLKTELKKITEDAKNTRAAADKATLQRNSERAEVVTSIVRYKDAQRLLKAAAAALQRVYKASKGGSALLQDGAPPNKVQYERSDMGAGVIGILEIAIQDFFQLQGQTEASKDDTTQEVAKLKAKIAEIDADLAQLKTELKKVTMNAKETRTQANKATLQRNSERAEVMASIVRYKDAQRLLKAAVGALKKVYKASKGGSALLQDDAPPTKVTYERSDMGAGVVGILEIAIQDFFQLQGQTEAAEKQAQKEYKDLMDTTEVQLAAMNKDLEYKNQAKVKLEGDRMRRSSFLKMRGKELVALAKYLSEVQVQCVKSDSYEKREKEYKDLMDTTEVQMAAMNKDLEYKNQAKIKLEGDRMRRSSFLKMRLKELEALAKYLAELEVQCVKTDSYDKRKARREKELASLKECLKALGAGD
eukprot:CAMPEP_0172784254 /NCGR_PEP_ID=MMETSP1074-20121228/204848_1 /TAXON_ID=2916 /ORGANISM="Ceratium fusus, Strain PA161109" /LENGTH=1190 /DNA_ID=CAMNT_0013621257 /DNA_START=45 /DNA_END=3619 /DNA_ORIENTATION=-